MTVTYDYDPVKRRIHTSCVGYVSVVDVVNHFHILSLDPAVAPGSAILLDLRALTSVPESAQMEEVSEQLRRVTQRRALARCAILADEGISAMVARLFQSTAARALGTIEIFANVEAAAAWLDQPQ